MFRTYMWDIFRLRSNFSGTDIQDVWGVFLLLGVGRGGGGGRSRCSNSGYHDLEVLQSGLSLVFYVHVSKWVSILMLKICYY